MSKKLLTQKPPLELQEDELLNKANFILMDMSSDFGIALKNIATGVCNIEIHGKTYQLQVKLEADPAEMYPYEL